MDKQYLNWQEVNVNWNNSNLNWEDIYILNEVNQLMSGGGGYAEYIKGNPWKRISEEIGKEKAKKFIKIFCTINNLNYSKTIEKNSKVKITVNHFNRVFNSIPNIKIKL